MQKTKAREGEKKKRDWIDGQNADIEFEISPQKSFPYNENYTLNFC